MIKWLTIYGKLKQKRSLLLFSKGNVDYYLKFFPKKQ